MNQSPRRLDQLLEPLATSGQFGSGVVDSTSRLRELFGVGAEDLLTTAELARDYQFSGPEAVRKHLGRHDVPYLRRGRIVLVDRRDFVASMTKARKVRLEQTA